MLAMKRTLVVAAALMVLGACSSNPEQPADRPAAGTTDSAAPTTNPVATAAPPVKGGAQLWSENCTRCHNARPPDYYSDAQWQVLVHHMRLRANLEGAEARTIVQFLQASN